MQRCLPSAAVALNAMPVYDAGIYRGLPAAPVTVNRCCGEVILPHLTTLSKLQCKGAGRWPDWSEHCTSGSQLSRRMPLREIRLSRKGTLLQEWLCQAF